MAQRRTGYERISQRNTGKTCSCPCATTNNCRMDGFSRISWISVAEKRPGSLKTLQTSPWPASQWRRGQCEPSCDAASWPGEGLRSYSLSAQTEEAGARVRRAEKQRRNRHIACKDALLIASGASAAHARVVGVQEY